MTSATIHKTPLIALVQAHVPHLLALYAFGSQVQGAASEWSDLDLAVLVQGYADPLELFDVAQQLADGFTGLACGLYRHAIPDHHDRSTLVAAR
jgi:predicted nucleotidyltransferase